MTCKSRKLIAINFEEIDSEKNSYVYLTSVIALCVWRKGIIHKTNLISINNESVLELFAVVN